MNADISGIVLSKAELAASIAAARKQDKSGMPDKLCAVAFETTDDTVTLYASNGFLAVRASGANQDLDGLGAMPPNRWRVDLEFLREVAKNVSGKGFARLCFNGKSLHTAAILATEDYGNGPELIQRGEYSWTERDAVDQQLKFPFDSTEEIIRNADVAETGVPSPITPAYYELLALIGRCGVEEFERCPGRKRTDPVLDTGETEDGTKWTCVCMPRATAIGEKDKPTESRQVEMDDRLEDQLLESLDALGSKGVSVNVVHTDQPPNNTKRIPMPDGIKRRSRKSKEKSDQ